MFSGDCVPKPLLSTLLLKMENTQEVSETTHLNCEAVSSFALWHPPAQDEVGGSAQPGEVVSK